MRFEFPFGISLRTMTLIGGLAIVLAATGCGQSGPELGRIRGTVKLDGQPVPYAQVYIDPEGEGRSAMGLANENGEYNVEYSPTADGAPVGPVIVRISTLTVDHPETIPAKYNTKSELKRVVEKGTNTFDFDLTSK